MDYGASIAAAFASPNATELEDLRTAIATCMRNADAYRELNNTNSERHHRLNSVPSSPHYYHSYDRNTNNDGDVYFSGDARRQQGRQHQQQYRADVPPHGHGY